MKLPVDGMFRTVDYSLQLLAGLKHGEPLMPMVFVGKIPIWLSVVESSESIARRCAQMQCSKEHLEATLSDARRRIVNEMRWSKPIPNQTLEQAHLLITHDAFPCYRASMIGLYELIQQYGKAGFEKSHGGDPFLISANFGSKTHMLLGVYADSYSAAKNFVMSAVPEIERQCAKAGIPFYPLEFPD